MPRDAGVTLVEMLVAMAIFAMIGLAGFTILDAVIRTGDRTGGRLEALGAIDRALVVFDRDMSESLPASLGRSGGALTFLRPTDRDRGVAEISYAADAGRLTRTISIAGQEPVEQNLLTGLSAARLRFLDAADTWHDLARLDDALPPLGAVELTLTLSPDMAGRSDTDRIRRLVRLAQPVEVAR